MAGNHTLPMHSGEATSLASNELTASSISGPSGGYGTTNSQHSADETTVSGVTLPTVLAEKDKPTPPPTPPTPQRNDSFSRRSQSRRTSSSRQRSATASPEGHPIRELSRSGSKSGSFTRRSGMSRQGSHRSHRSGLEKRESQRSGTSLKRGGSHRSQRSKQMEKRESQRSQSTRSNRSRRRIDDDMGSSSSSSSWETDLGEEEMDPPISRRSLGANSSASTIFESVASSEESSEMEEASEVSYETASSSSSSSSGDEEMDDDENDSESSASYPIISFPDNSSIVSGLTDADMDLDVTRLTLLRNELNDLKQRAITEGDELSKEELIRCLERLQNIQEDVILDAAAETRSLASELNDSFRHTAEESRDSKSRDSKSSFSSGWDTDPELPPPPPGEEEEDVTPKSMRKELSHPELMDILDSPKIVEENRTPRKGKRPEMVAAAVSAAIGAPDLVTPRAANLARKAEVSKEAPPAKKKKKKRTSKEKKARTRKSKKSDGASVDDDGGDAGDDATPKVKRKKKAGGKTKKKGKTKEKKVKGGKTKRRKNGDKNVAAHIDMGKKYVDKFDEGEHSDTDKTPRRRTAKGAVNMSGGSGTKSKNTSYIARNSERLFRHPLFQSNLDVPTSPEQTEVVDGELNASPSAIPKRTAEERESSRRSRRSVTLPRFLTGSNVTPSPGSKSAKSPASGSPKSPGILHKKVMSNASLGIFVSATPPTTPPAVRGKTLPAVPQTDPTAGRKKRLSRFLKIGGRNDDSNTLDSSKRSEPGKLSKEKEEDNLNSTDHAVAAGEGSQRIHRTGGKKKDFNGADSPSSMLSKKKSVRGTSTIRESVQETEKASMDARDHAVIESSPRQKRQSLLTKTKSLRDKLESEKEEGKTDSLNETNHAVVQPQGSKAKRRGSLGRIFGSVHTAGSSARYSNPSIQVSISEDAEDISSPTNIQTKMPAVPQTDPTAFKRRSVTHIFTSRARSRSPSSVVTKPKKPGSSSSIGNLSKISIGSKQSMASGVISDAESSTRKRRSFGRLFGRGRSRSPSAAPTDAEDISSPKEVQRNSIGEGVPETDPGAAARRSLGRLSLGGGVSASPQIGSRRSMRTTRTTLRNSGGAIPRKSASVRTERTMSIDEPSPAGLHFRNRIGRVTNSGSSSMRSRRTLGEDVDASPSSRRAFPSYSNVRGRSTSPSAAFRSSKYQAPAQSPGAIPVRGRKASRPSFTPKTAPVGLKAGVSTGATRRGSQRSGQSFPMVPDLLDSGDEMDDDLERSRRSHNSRHSARFVDSSGHVRTVDVDAVDDDQLDLDNTTNHSTGEKGGRKARRGGKRNTLSPSPRTRTRKKIVTDEDPARTSVARAKERRSQLSKDRERSSETSNGLRIPRRKKSDTKSKRSHFKSSKEEDTESTQQDEAEVGEVKSGMKSKNGSSRGMRSINNLVNRIRHKSTDPIDC